MRKDVLTLPTDIGMVEETLKLCEELGADAIRDCDGTEMPEELKSSGKKIYATYYTTRKDNAWAMKNPEEVQQEYLISARKTAFGDSLSIRLMEGFFEEQLKVNELDDPKRWWEVIDRTTGNVVPVEKWQYNSADGTVTIETIPYHEYTVSFLAFLIWDPVHMYNFLTNSWEGVEHQMTYDVRQPKTKEYVKEKLHRYCKENPAVTVIRFTTFFHQFTLTFDEKRREKYAEWFGYSASVSPYILEKFEKWAGYPFRAEYIVDQGCFNSTFRVPSKEFLDFIKFQNIEVIELIKELADIVHSYGKEVMMFLGDHWIGTEPYGELFKEAGVDAIVGSVGDGVTLRMISDIKNARGAVKYTEGRFLPYFFPDVFRPGGEPIKEAVENWVKARRAILRSPLDRIGYGGYLKYAVEWPGFVDVIKNVVEEFSEILDKSAKNKSYTEPFKVAVLNAWGEQRRWMCNQVMHAIYHRETYSTEGVLEALSGLPFDIRFLSFEDVKQGIPEDVGVIINTGDAMTSFSGGEHWLEAEVLSSIRKFVANGGGFIGVGEPSACFSNGRYFQLSDVLGCDREMGVTLSTDKYWEEADSHMILEDTSGQIDFGDWTNRVYPMNTGVSLERDGEYSRLVVNEYGKGKSVYFAGLPYSPENCRLLLRAIYYTAGKEDSLKKYYVSHLETEVAAFPESGVAAIINNNCYKECKTDFYLDGKLRQTLTLGPGEMRWVEI